MLQFQTDAKISWYFCTDSVFNTTYFKQYFVFLNIPREDLPHWPHEQISNRTEPPTVSIFLSGQGLEDLSSGQEDFLEELELELQYLPEARQSKHPSSHFDSKLHRLFLVWRCLPPKDTKQHYRSIWIFPLIFQHKSWIPFLKADVFLHVLNLTFTAGGPGRQESH